jgi:phage protein D
MDNIEPVVRIVANDKDITDKIAERFSSLTLTDETGTTSDTVEITLTDHIPEKRIKVPPQGAELEVSIGYGDKLVRKGVFVCDEIELSGPPGKMVIRARASTHEKTPTGKKDMQSHKTRSWPKGTTIGAMVKRIAGEHGLKPAVSKTLASVALPHTDQAHESDMNLLIRIAKRYDAIAKPAGGSLIFTKRGEATSVSGEPLARNRFAPGDGGEYTVTRASREGAGTAVAYYRDKRAAKQRYVSVGDGDPVFRLRKAYADRVSAESAAKSELQAKARATEKLVYTFPGRPEVAAEGLAIMSGFREGVDGEWLIERAEHSIDSSGYTCRIECVKPNSAERPAKAAGAAVEDDVQAATEVD